jgi:hypothetical protein
MTNLASTVSLCLGLAPPACPQQPAAAVSAAYPCKSAILHPLLQAAEEKADLIEFQRSLNDEELLKDPRWSDPWR